MWAAVASTRDVASGVSHARSCRLRDALGRRSPRRAPAVSPVRVIEKEPSVLYDFSSEKPRVSPDGWMETLRDATPRNCSEALLATLTTPPRRENAQMHAEGDVHRRWCRVADRCKSQQIANRFGQRVDVS